MLDLMDNAPYEFILSASEQETSRFSGFVPRTFNSTDCTYFLLGLRNIYNLYNSMEEVIIKGIGSDGKMKDGITYLRTLFFSQQHLHRTEKHFADIIKGASGERLNIYLRINKVAY